MQRAENQITCLPARRKVGSTHGRARPSNKDALFWANLSPGKSGQGSCVARDTGRCARRPACEASRDNVNYLFMLTLSSSLPEKLFAFQKQPTTAGDHCSYLLLPLLSSHPCSFYRLPCAWYYTRFVLHRGREREREKKKTVHWNCNATLPYRQRLACGFKQRYCLLISHPPAVDLLRLGPLLNHMKRNESTLVQWASQPHSLSITAQRTMQTDSYCSTLMGEGAGWLFLVTFAGALIFRNHHPSLCFTCCPSLVSSAPIVTIYCLSVLTAFL